jgi:hypothetical protein
MPISNWSTVAGNNNAPPPNGAPEGMPPNAVNDTMREIMASVRAWYENAQWINFGLPLTYISSTQFSTAGNYASVYSVGRRVRINGTSLSFVSASVYDSTNTIVTLEDAVVNSPLTTAEVSILTDTALPKSALTFNTVSGTGVLQKDATHIFGSGDFYTKAQTDSTFETQAHASSTYAPLANPAFTGTPKVGTNTIWHSGNDGAGSGLDADLVRGQVPDFSSILGQTGAQKLPSGLIIQWGRVALNASENRTINLPTPFTSTGYAIVASFYDIASGGREEQAAAAIVSNSQITVRNPEDTANTLCWIAIGV